MRAYRTYLGFPRFTTVIRRSRIESFAGLCAPDDHIILSAPSGYGKTVAASQIASVLGGPVAWVKVGGEECSLPRVLLSLVHALDQNDDDRPPQAAECDLSRRSRLAIADRWPGGGLVVLDDVGVADPQALATLLESVAAEFAHFGVRLLVTTRLPFAGTVGASIDESHLSFSDAEVVEVAGALGLVGPRAETAVQVARTCNGHPALTTTLLAAPEYDVKSGSAAISNLVDRIASTGLDVEAARLLRLIRMVKRMSLTDAMALGICSPMAAAAELSRVLPLVQIEGGGVSDVFVAHDLICTDFEVDAVEAHYAELLDSLVRNSEITRLSAALRLPGLEDQAVDWLELNADSVLGWLGAAECDRVLSALPLRTLVARSRIMLLWAHSMRGSGKDSDALTKSKIAGDLAAHEHDLRTLALSVALRVNCIASAGDAEAALLIGQQYLSRLTALNEPRARTEYMAALANAAAGASQEEAFYEYASEARAISDGNLGVEGSLRRIRRAEATLHVFGRSDWKSASSILLPLAQDDTPDDLYTWITVRGNAACCLVEMGRISRAKGLLAAIVNRDFDLADGSYLPVLGTAHAAEGNIERAIEEFRDGIAIALKYGDEVDVGHSRIWLATVLRAAGMTDLSLEASERAYEGLCSEGVGAFRQLAGIEVAASLLASDDVTGCVAWTAGLTSDKGLSPYAALRLAMVVSQCVLSSADTLKARDALCEHAQEIMSGNSNWQMAMYCRAFPELLGMLAMAVGAANLPIHMLRMVLPEHAERSLVVARPFMPAEEWRVLGKRVLGDEQFAVFVERDGKPLLRVRLFGGFEATVGDRALRERDWTKRKGRLIFAMLVARRGQEVARDQILEHLWPDLSDEKAKNNFYVAWSTMKAALMLPEQRGEQCPYVESIRGRCRVVSENVRSDIDEFESQVARAHVAESEGRGRDAVEAYAELMRVYRGDLLPGDLYDDWFSVLRDKYRFDFVDAMMRATALLMEMDDPCEALLFVRRGISADPYREDLYQMALRCHLAAGQRSAAIETFIQCRTQLADELGLDPSAETMALYQQILVMEECPRWDSYGVDSN